MGVIDYLGDNAVQIDAKEYEGKVREDEPRLLQSDERVVFAFKGRGGKGRDHHLLTTKRVLVRDKKGMTGKRIRYTSVPYKAIRAFSLETAGTVDDDQELKIYARGIGKVSLDLVKSINVMPIHRFLSSVVTQGKGAGEVAAGAFVHDTGANVNSTTGLFDLLGSNYAQMDKQEVEARLKGDQVLLDGKFLRVLLLLCSQPIEWYLKLTIHKLAQMSQSSSPSRSVN